MKVWLHLYANSWAEQLYWKHPKNPFRAHSCSNFALQTKREPKTVSTAGEARGQTQTKRLLRKTRGFRRCAAYCNFLNLPPLRSIPGDSQGNLNRFQVLQLQTHWQQFGEREIDFSAHLRAKAKSEDLNDSAAPPSLLAFLLSSAALVFLHKILSTTFFFYDFRQVDRQ